MLNKKSSEMFINMKDVPTWDKTKHYFDQRSDVLKFYQEEFYKVKNGINIGGYHMHPLLYFNLNFFKTPIPTLLHGQLTPKDVMMNPPLDDNIMYIIDSYYDAQRLNKILFLFGTRGFAKALENNEKLLYSDETWKPIGDSKVGDMIYGADGKLTKITGVYPQGVLDLYEVTLSCGRVIKCCEEHLWQVYDKKYKKTRTVPLKDIIQNYKTKGISRYHIPTNKPVIFTEKEVREEYYDFHAIRRREELPQELKTTGIQSRIKILYKVLGEESSVKHLYFTEKSFRDDVASIARSLGLNLRTGGDNLGETITFKHPIVFKEDTEGILSVQQVGKKYSAIIKIEPAGKSLATCIRVDNRERTFLTTDYVVTHNTTFLSCLTHHTILTTPDGNFSITGGDEGDLKSIASLMDKSFNRIIPPFFIPTLTKDWDEHIKFGFKDKSTSGKEYVHSEIRIVNAVKGTASASEKGAGLSPIGYIIDEAGKFAFIKILESALPSFKTPHGYRLVPVLSGTSGNTELSKDAREVLENPDVYDILPANFDRLSRGLSLEDITWKEDFDRKFGTFVPGQMTYRLNTKKKESTLDAYLGLSNKELRKLKINVTDWKNITEEINNLGGKGAKEKTRNKNKMYYPTKIDHCFLTAGTNPFPTTIIERQIQKLRNSGDTGKNVEIYKDGAIYKQKFSTKQRAEVVHPGGNVDAPVILFGELPETPPERYVNVSGLDDYKLNKSDTDSLGAFYIIKRRNLSINTPCETIQACYVSRPDMHKEFHKQVESLIEAWNAECLMESIDVSFEDYLEERGKAGNLLAPAITFAKSKESRNRTSSQKLYGLHPTEGNNEHRMNKLVDWCWEEHTVGFDAEGNKITKYSVEFIDDIDLLEELLNWTKGKNSDRKEAFSHALLHAITLDVDGVKPKSMNKGKGILNVGRKHDENNNQGNTTKRKTTSVNMPFGKTRFNPYST